MAPRRKPNRFDTFTGRTAWKLAHSLRGTELQAATITDVNDGFRLEVAWDGHPVLAVRSGTDARVFGLDMRDWSGPAQNIALTLLDAEADPLVLEGMLCVFDETDGRPSFQALQQRVATGKGPAPVFMVSQVLQWGTEVFSTGRARADAARRLRPSPAVVLSDELPGAAREVLDRVQALGLRGVLGRPLDERRLARLVSCDETPLPTKRPLSAPPVVTNGDKVLFPRDGIRKREAVQWYSDVAPVLLPHLQGRPVVSQRWPDGIDDFMWFQHRPPPRAPDYLEAVELEGDRRLLINNTDALLWMANQAALTFHTWATRADALLNPDWAIIDLDPGPKTKWPEVIETAVAIRRLLELLEVPSVVKTSGQKGLHILVPLSAGQSLETAFQFSSRVCAMVAELMPAVVSLTHDEVLRQGRLFLDHLQNFRGKTLVAPYSLRAVDGAPVSTPIAWDEVTPGLDPKSFTRSVVLDRLARHGDLFAPVLSAGISLEAALARLTGR